MLFFSVFWQEVNFYAIVLFIFELSPSQMIFDNFTAKQTFVVDQASREQHFFLKLLLRCSHRIFIVWMLLLTSMPYLQHKFVERLLIQRAITPTAGQHSL